MLKELTQNQSELFNFLWIIFIILTILATIYYIFMVVMLFFLFRKEKIKDYYALIPFYNLYHYYKICKCPFWTVFIPLVNIVILIASPYRLFKEYQRPIKERKQAVLLPFIYLPKLIFNDSYLNKRFKPGYADFKETFNIDTIENNNISDEDEYIDVYSDEEIKISKDKKPTNKKEEMIANIEAIADQYYDMEEEEAKMLSNIQESSYESYESINEEFIPETVDAMQMYEMFDTINDTDGKFTSKDVETLEEVIKQNNKVEVADTTDYKEYEEKETTDKAIAFGGEKKLENKSEAIKDELKCPRCGSSLINAENDTCPGCGAKISVTA